MPISFEQNVLRATMISNLGLGTGGLWGLGRGLESAGGMLGLGDFELGRAMASAIFRWLGRGWELQLTV